MLKYSKEVKTGVIALCAIVLLIFGYSYLKGKNLLEDDRTFYAIYKNVEGLIPSSPVSINGMIIGQVVDVDFADTKGNLIVKFTVNHDFSFSKNSLAKIYSGGLLGGKSLAILPKYEKGKEAMDQDTLRSSIEVGLIKSFQDRLAPLQEKLEMTITDVDTLLKAVVSDQNQMYINTVFKDLSLAVTEFKRTSKRLNAILIQNEQKIHASFNHFNAVTTNLDRMTTELSKANFVQISKNFEQMGSNLNLLTTRLNQGKGTAGKLLKDEQLYSNLNKAAKEMGLLLQDFRLHPTRYINVSVFGKKDKPYVAPQPPNLN